MNDPRVFKRGIRNGLGYTRSDKNLGLKGQGHRVNRCIFHTNSQSITQKRMIPKCSKFKLDVECRPWDILLQVMWFWVVRSRLGLRLVAIRRGFELSAF